MESDRPIVVLPFDRILQGLALGMTLNAGVIRGDKIEFGWIDDIQPRGIRGVLASGPVATLTSDIPFFDRFRPDIVVDGMTTIAEGSRRPLVIVGGIERHPPIRIRLYEIRSPHLVVDIPLRREREIVIADFLEVALFPLRPVH